MRIAVFGLGYVGTVSAACLAGGGHQVIGVDPNPLKIEPINGGRSPVIEPGLEELISEAVAAGRLSATGDVGEALAASDLALICVGTPSQANGALDLTYLARVIDEIGAGLAGRDGDYVVVVRSTVLPGTMRDLVVPRLEAASGRALGDRLGLCHNPEFLREGSAVADYYGPPKTVIGESDAASGELVAALYDGIDAPLFRTELAVAEMVKYADNSWHALKVEFGNEIGAICKAKGLDSHRVMDIFTADTKLNLSPYYLRPGFSFGGSCLPKDVRALIHAARSSDVAVPVLEAILPGNEAHLKRGVELIRGKGKRNIGMLGLSFKSDTDDLRESPLVEMAERLLGKGHDLRIFDRNVSLARLVGANRDYILNVIPHVSNLLVDSIDAVLDHAEVVVIGNGDKAFRDVPARLRPGQDLVDLVRIGEDWRNWDGYDGICW